jgi:stage V sporulation protein R
LNAAEKRVGVLPPVLAKQAERTERLARSHGLDFFEVVFELLDAVDVNGIAAYGGFPVRYPSWRHGMEFERLDKGYSWGLSKIYELVINNDPVVAYLVRSNSDLEQKLVMAHVFGHADFFKHNSWFAATDRRMLDHMGSHSTRVRRYIDAYGLETVERYLDQVLSLENLIDPYLPLRARMQEGGDGVAGLTDGPAPEPLVGGRGTYDVLGFLLTDARALDRLEDWQVDVLRIVRAEAYYFQPQRMTKIMNEGWASFWHSRMLTGGLLDASEIVDFADCHSSATMSTPGRMNPYKLGIELFRHAEASGRDIFRLRRIHNDATFIDEMIDEDFVERQLMFVYGKNSRSGRTEVTDRDWRKVKERLLLDLSWGGMPQIELCAVDTDGEGELLLEHRHDGRDLQLAQAEETLRRLAAVWRGPVHLRTQEESQGRLVKCSEEGEIEVLETQDTTAEPEPFGPIQP